MDTDSDDMDLNLVTEDSYSAMAPTPLLCQLSLDFSRMPNYSSVTFF